MIRLCGLLLLRGAGWAGYTLALATLVVVALRLRACADGCEKVTEGDVLAIVIVGGALLAIIGSLAMAWAGAIARRWLALRPSDRRWLATGIFYTLTLPLVTASAGGMVVAGAWGALKTTSGPPMVEARLAEIESSLRVLMMDRGRFEAMSGPNARLIRLEREFKAFVREQADRASPEITGGEEDDLRGEEGRRLR